MCGEFFSKTFLACLSGAQVGSIIKKNDQKSRDTTTLIYSNLNMRMCDAESQKRSAKGSNFKDDHMALSL